MRLADVWQDMQTVTEARKRGERLAAEIAARLDRLTRASDRPRVTVIEWLVPPLPAGHWITDPRPYRVPGSSRPSDGRKRLSQQPWATPDRGR